MASAPPSWTDYGCPISPQGSQGLPGEHCAVRSHNATSPGNSDNNSYPSPLISPGDWNVSSPSSNVSSGLHGSVQSFNGSSYGTPNSVPPGMESSVSSRASSCESPPSLPANLGNNPASDNRTVAKKEALKSINQKFMSKTAVDREREQVASRRALALIEQATAVQNMSHVTQYHPVGAAPSVKVRHTTVIVPDGCEHLATSTRKSTKAKVPDEDVESVDDFKCQYDKDREKWAKSMALRLFKTQGVEGAA
jgi:hypothetical protein